MTTYFKIFTMANGEKIIGSYDSERQTYNSCILIDNPCLLIRSKDEPIYYISRYLSDLKELLIAEECIVTVINNVPEHLKVQYKLKLVLYENTLDILNNELHDIQNEKIKEVLILIDSKINLLH